MSRRTVRELVDGESVEEIYVIADKQLRANRNGNTYLLANLRDKTGAISGLMWNVNEPAMAHIDSGDFVKVQAKVQMFQGTLQMILTKIEGVPADGLDPEEFAPQAACDVQRLTVRLTELVADLDDENVRSLLQRFLADETFMQGFTQAPAGTKAHHAYLGGLLEHAVNMMEVADRIAPLYPNVDFNLVKAGVLLHDSGKIRELGYEDSFLYTDAGQLLGHLVIGVEMLNEKLAEWNAENETPFPEETALRIKHLILSHHGTHEFGSPKVPMTPEAVVLHHIDNLDAKVNEFLRDIDDDPNVKSRWTAYNQRLGRKLFKGSTDEAND
ncbi:3'-5' exoribonuclease YhaM family protein [Symmachiella dynata]|uniref:3'-5' exoribonuclease YhaM family protein n=1 Tax=Symmachiella dynata TaxID=2527995 RepID=UPI0030EEF963|tara:strand:- start:92 stop:1072 length:981 start_codon:yes stop_codon:yes gene_type:complete